MMQLDKTALPPFTHLVCLLTSFFLLRVHLITDIHKTKSYNSQKRRLNMTLTAIHTDRLCFKIFVLSINENAHVKPGVLKSCSLLVLSLKTSSTHLHRKGINIQLCVFSPMK